MKLRVSYCMFQIASWNSRQDICYLCRILLLATFESLKYTAKFAKASGISKMDVPQLVYYKKPRKCLPENVQLLLSFQRDGTAPPSSIIPHSIQVAKEIASSYWYLETLILQSLPSHKHLKRLGWELIREGFILPIKAFPSLRMEGYEPDLLPGECNSYS